MEAGKSKIKVLADPPSGKNHCPDSSQFFVLTSHGGKGKDLCEVFPKCTHHIHEGSSLMT